MTSNPIIEKHVVQKKVFSSLNQPVILAGGELGIYYLNAEKLAEESDVNVAFKELQVLHKMWKEEVGPVARDQRELIWGRFSEATKKVHDKRHDFFKNLKSQYEDNIEKKLEVIKEIDNYDTSAIKTRAEWQRGIKDRP